MSATSTGSVTLNPPMTKTSPASATSRIWNSIGFTESPNTTVLIAR